MPQLLNSDLREQLREEGLRYISDSTPGFSRQKGGEKFRYYDINGKQIKDASVIDRIEKLVIPPAWVNVWISPKPNTHIQATGIDARHRKQYIYHPDWVKIAQENKFEKIIDFGLNLPKIRNRVQNDLQEEALDKKRVLATVVWLLERTFIRVGNEEYYKENDSFGLTTLRNKHVKVKGSKIFFSFKGKSGVETDIEISNPKIAKTIKKCIELPGYELFRFLDEDGNNRIIDSEDVNTFLKEVTGNDFTAKDFRTWGATSLSAKNLFKTGFVPDEKIIKKNVVETVKKVARDLNNTVAVCRNYYIHPTIFKTYREDILVPHFEYYSKEKKEENGLNWHESALIKLLEKYS